MVKKGDGIREKSNTEVEIFYDAHSLLTKHSHGRETEDMCGMADEPPTAIPQTVPPYSPERL